MPLTRRELLRVASLSAAVPFLQPAFAAAKPAPHTPRLLLVDADPLVQQMVGKLLALDGVHVTGCSNGREVLQHLTGDTSIDAVLVMPGEPSDMDALALVRELALTSPRLRSILFAHSEEEQRRIQEAGGCPVHPGDKAALLSAIRSANRPT